MKIISIIFSLLTFSSVFACEIQEAQFIGTVKNFTQNESICTYKIEFSYFSSSNECPLVIGEVSLAPFQDISCSLKDGDKVSGILAKKDGNIIY